MCSDFYLKDSGALSDVSRKIKLSHDKGRVRE